MLHHSDLEGNDAVDGAGADVGEHEDLVAGLLDAREDPGDGPQGQEEGGDGRLLPGVPVLVVDGDLKGEEEVVLHDAPALLLMNQEMVETRKCRTESVRQPESDRLFLISS